MKADILSKYIDQSFYQKDMHVLSALNLFCLLRILKNMTQ
jgi:hypothetical protein